MQRYQGRKSSCRGMKLFLACRICGFHAALVSFLSPRNFTRMLPLYFSRAPEISVPNRPSSPLFNTRNSILLTSFPRLYISMVLSGADNSNLPSYKLFVRNKRQSGGTGLIKDLGFVGNALNRPHHIISQNEYLVLILHVYDNVSAMI